MTPTNEAELDVYVKAALGKKARDPVLLDVSRLTSLADAFLICHGTSNRQVSAHCRPHPAEPEEAGHKAPEYRWRQRRPMGAHGLRPCGDSRFL